MATILVYDSDFFHYPSVIPNLECAKYSAWRKRHRDIVAFNPNLDPSMYTKVFYRKEYDDGIYNEVLQAKNIEYGGRAFSSIYKPFDLGMERIIPDFEIYKKYTDYYGKGVSKKEEIKIILYATHVRLSLDGRALEPFPYERLQPYHPNIILHDYDLAAVPGAFELLQDVSKRRPSGLPYKIGNKYPINIYNYDELQQWLSLPPMGACFYLQYNNLFKDEEIIELCSKPIMGFRKMIYNFTYGYSDENDFVKNGLSNFYKQMLFLRSHKLKILLNIDTEFFKTPELLNLMKLISCYYGKTNLEYVMPHTQTLYGYCAWKRRPYIETFPWMKHFVTQQQMRESFQYMRKANYEVFDMFYSMPNVIAKGGKLVNEWSRDS